MATIIAYDCRCGERYSVYMPKARMVFDPKKKYIQAAKEWDEADVASGEIKIAKRSAVLIAGLLSMETKSTTAAMSK